MPRIEEVRIYPGDTNAPAPEAIVAVDAPRNVLVCLLCRTGVSTAATHFRNRHRLKGAPLEAVLAFCRSAVEGGVAHDPATATLPPDGAAAHAGLTIADGYTCTVAGCLYRTINRKKILHHARTAPHGGVPTSWAPVRL